MSNISYYGFCPENLGITLTLENLTQRKKKHVLQWLSQIVAIISAVFGIVMGGYLLVFVESGDKIQQSFLGAITFFCLIMALVLHYISTTNLPDLSVPNDEDIKKQSAEFKARDR